mmetsp:Transcript_17827/g.51035  ORF Transcript_17827/g.51035 Transcript_17827/m.51035 type:complete len:498 (+) Transcript_17827:231-1724(+)
MTMSEADTNQASEPMTAPAPEPATTVVGKATELKPAADESQSTTNGSFITQNSTIVPPDADTNDRLVSLVVKQRETKQAVASTGNASSEEESPKLVASLKPPQDVSALPTGVSNPVSPSSVEDDASKPAVEGPDNSNTPPTIEATKKPVSTGAILANSSTGSAKAKRALSSSPNDSLRRGKWTPEEEEYVTRVISDFNAGFLRAPPGTTLRSYLSEKLNCDPMRITKKFTGELAIGKRVFHPVARTLNNAEYIDKAQSELDELERKWRRRLETQEQESARKAAVSAAAAASGRLGDPNNRLADAQIKRNLIAKTAAWLDRADAILSVGGKGASASPDTGSSEESKPSQDDESADQLPQSVLESQMKEVEKLLNEGTLIQKTSKGLPKLLQGASGADLVPSSDASNKKRSGSFSAATATTEAGQGTKRPKRSFSDNHLVNLPTFSTTDTADTEGAHTLVGLLHVNNAQLQARTSTDSSSPSTTARIGATNNQARRHSE